MTFLSEFIKSLSIQDLQEYQNLALFPLSQSEFRGQGYLLLDEALEQDVLEVLEVSDAGSINEVFLRNSSDSAYSDEFGHQFRSISDT